MADASSAADGAAAPRRGARAAADFRGPAPHARKNRRSFSTPAPLATTQTLQRPAGATNRPGVCGLPLLSISRRIVMANGHYPPTREADLITATQTFLDVATPVPATYSLTVAQLTT